MGRTLQQVADDIGSTKAHLSVLERGLVEPRGLTKVKLSRYYGVSREHLFPYEGNGAKAAV